MFCKGGERFHGSSLIKNSILPRELDNFHSSTNMTENNMTLITLLFVKADCQDSPVQRGLHFKTFIIGLKVLWGMLAL